jgi:phage terminase large subunit-like protein
MMMASRTSSKTATIRHRVKYPDNYNPILEYWQEINNGLVVCEKIRATYKKLVDDLSVQDGEFFYSPQRANHMLEFVENFCHHSKGKKFGGKLIRLELWEKALLAAIFGFIDQDGNRKYREAVLIVGKKNGKSLIASAVGLYLLLADSEPGPEIYAVAPLALNTPVLTANGEKTMGSIVAGDMVFTPSGDQTRVDYVSPVVIRDTFRVRFDDGSSIIATGNHPWTVEQLGSNGKGKTLAWTTVDVETKDMRVTYNGRHATRILCAKAPKFLEANLPIKPYTLGVWLGDGRNNRGCICGHVDDVELREAVQMDGYEISYMRQQNNTVYFTVIGLRRKLREAGLLDNKHIPDIYFFASVGQRIELLRGLMDTDGTCTQTGECRYVGNYEQLCRDVLRLALSLGYKAHLHTAKDQNGKTIYVVSFKAYSVDGTVFKLSRKAERQRATAHAKSLYRYVIGVDMVESVPCRCISVEDERHLFCVGRELIATHNTKRDQAKIIWSEAKRMRNKSPALRKRVRALVAELVSDFNDGIFKPLASDVDTLDGLNVQGALMDEFHQWRHGRALFDIIADGVSAREQPLILETSTAGTIREDFYDEKYEEARNIIDNYSVADGYRDDRFIAFIYELDRREEWMDESCWIKANPGLGTIKNLDTLRRKVERAKKNRNLVKNMLCKEFNVRETSTESWLPFEACVNETIVCACDNGHWTTVDASQIDGARCPVCGKPITTRLIEEALSGSYAVGGCDLSATTDLTCATLLIRKPNDNRFFVIQKYFLPRTRVDEVEESSKREAPYELWAEQGWLHICEGATVDFHAVTQWFVDMVEKHDIRPLMGIYYDRALSGYWIPEMQSYGFEMHDTPQGSRTWTYPMKNMGGLLEEHRIIYNNNPMLRWCLTNTKKKSKNENGIESIEPEREKTSKRIDGMVSLLNAFVGFYENEDEYMRYIR